MGTSQSPMSDEWQWVLRDQSYHYFRQQSFHCGRKTAYALVTHATSGENPSIWSFSRSRTDCETNMGKYEFCTPSSLISLLNQSKSMRSVGNSARTWRAPYVESLPRYCMTRVWGYSNHWRCSNQAYRPSAIPVRRFSKHGSNLNFGINWHLYTTQGNRPLSRPRWQSEQRPRSFHPSLALSHCAQQGPGRTRWYWNQILGLWFPRFLVSWDMSRCPFR